MNESYLSWLRLIPGVSSDLARGIAERYPDPELLKGARLADLATIPGMKGEVGARVLELVRTASSADREWYRDEPALYLCPECGSFVGKGSNACPFCGVVFDEGDGPTTPASPVEELLKARNGEAKICTHCGAFLEPGATACGMCQTEYVVERLAELPAVDTTPIPDTEASLCPHCGAFLGAGTTHCMICGTAVAGEARVPAISRNGKGVSKDFLSRWERAATEVATAAPSVIPAKTIQEELLENEKLIEAEPALERAWVRRGRLLVQLGLAAEAVPCFDRAGRINPENDEAYRREALDALGAPQNPSILPARWAPEPESARPIPELRPGPSAVDAGILDATEEIPKPAPEPATPAAIAPKRAPLPAVQPVPARPPAAEAAAIRRAIAYYDRLLDMDAGLRVAWQTKGELLSRLGRKEEADGAFQRASDLEVAERELGRAALTGLQTQGPPRAGTRRDLALRGRKNGRVNGLTNGRRGRTNGRVNGITNGAGSTNGLTNGLGRVNGLMSGLARGEGRTNGLVNGNGFTNGTRGRSKGPLPSQGREWARSLAGIAAVVLLMVLAPILVSVLTTPPATSGIAIDGHFGDWARVPVQYADPVGDTRGNPDVDLVSYKLAAAPFGLSVYARVNGRAFEGAGNGSDVLVALIDSDGRADTGYDAGRLGADYAVEIAGWDGTIHETPLYHWRTGANRTDWFGFQSAGSAAAASSGSEVEFSLELDQASGARVLLAAVDGLGQADVADAVVIPGEPALSVRQRTIAPDVITTTSGVGVLRLDLTPAGPPVDVTLLNVTKRGSVADSTLTLSLYADDGDGLLTPLDALLGTSGVAQGVASFPLALTLDRATTWFVTADLATLRANETFGLGVKEIGAVRGVVSVAASDLSLSYLARAPAPTVDGAFADWAGTTLSVDPVGDVANRTGVPALLNANVDLTEVGSVLSLNATFYLRVDGTMLGGVDVPNLRTRTPALPPVDSDLDSVPDNLEATLGPGLQYDFNNDNVSDANSNGDVDQDNSTDWPNGPDVWLNTTIPSWYPAPYGGRVVSRYIGPIAPRILEGVDSAIVYLDGDNNTGTGLVVNSGTTAYGLDWAVVVAGRHGTVTSSALYRYRSGSAVPWALVTSVPAAVDATRLEVSVPNTLLNLSSDYRTVYYATDWQLSFDVALPLPPGRSPAPGPGTRSPAGDNVVINELSPRPNPEWIEFANPTSGSIALSGWTIQRRSGGSPWLTVYTFPSGSSIGAWGSGSEYITVGLTNDLPNGGASVRLRDASGSVVDMTMYPNLANGESWARFKDPTTGKPMDSDSDAADFYQSLLPSKGAPNDRHRPTITVAKTANRATAAPGDQIVYTVYYNNTDTGRANHVWINDTLPAQVTYVSSSVPPTSSSGQVYRWHFTNVAPNSLNSLTITARVNDGTGNGVVLVNRGGLEYTDQLNRKSTGSSAWRNVTVQRPVITVAKIGDKKTALPGDTIVYTIFYNNTGSASAQHVWINDTLPADVTFVSSSVPPTSFSGRAYRWHFTNVAPGAHSFTITVRVNANPSSSLLVNWVFLNYTTQTGYPLEESRSSWTTSIPEFSDLALVAVVPLIFLGIRRLRRGKPE